MKHIYDSIVSVVLVLVSFSPVTMAQVTDGTFNALQVNSNLTVDGSSWLGGGDTKFGSFVYSSTKYPQLTISAFGNETETEVEYIGTAEEVSFTWVDGIDNKMLLSSDNSLSLKNYFSGGTSIILNPGGLSYFDYDIELRGEDNQMPNQTIVGDGSILNVGLADDRYAKANQVGTFIDGASNGNFDSWAIGDSSVVNLPTGNSNSFAIGDHNTVTAGDAVAIGNYNQATGWANFVAGSHAYGGGFSTQALGHGARSFGTQSLALSGSGSWGYYTTSMGLHTNSRAHFATSMGRDTDALHQLVVAMGRLNLFPITPNYSWAYSDPLFVIGNGEYLDASGNIVADRSATEYSTTYYNNYRAKGRRSNALVVYKDGRMDVIAHREAPSGPIFTVKDGSADPANPVSVMSVSKGGDIWATSISLGSLQSEVLWTYHGSTTEFFEVGTYVTAGAGNSVLENGYSYSVIGDFAHSESTPLDTVSPSFVVGAGVGYQSSQRANAMAVREDGDVDVAGALRVPPAGDLSMGSFTSGRDPREALDPNEILPSADWGEEQL